MRESRDLQVGQSSSKTGLMNGSLFVPVRSYNTTLSHGRVAVCCTWNSTSSK